MTVLELALGFALGSLISQFTMGIYILVRYRLHARKHPPTDNVDVEALMDSFRQAYMKEHPDDEPTQG